MCQARSKGLPLNLEEYVDLGDVLGVLASSKTFRYAKMSTAGLALLYLIFYTRYPTVNHRGGQTKQELVITPPWNHGKIASLPASCVYYLYHAIQKTFGVIKIPRNLFNLELRYVSKV